MFHRFILIIFLFAYSLVQAQEEKVRTLDVLWYTSRPFIYEDENEQLAGIDYDIIEAFGDYMRNKKGVPMDIHWKKAESFASILEIVKEHPAPNEIGVSAFSVTDERKEFAKFTEVYLTDVCVLVSSKETPIARSEFEMNNMLKEMDAVTIVGTWYEVLLDELIAELDLDINVIYIESDKNILDNISAAPNRFGFIDLPVYLMLIQNGGKLTRQNLYTSRGDGYAYLLPLNSVWEESLNDFLSDPESQRLISNIMSQYLGNDLYDFLEDMEKVENEISTSILTKEKELQLELIESTNSRLIEEQSENRILLIGFITSGVFLLTVIYLFFRNRKTTRLLIEQRDKIVDQQEDIGLKNEQLVDRNSQLMVLNEEKNNLIKILAHDIRSPLSQIIMITEILQDPTNEGNDRKDEFLKQVGLNAHRISEMVAKILDMDNLEGDKFKVLRERLDVNNIINEIKNRYGSRAERKGIKLVAENCPNNNIIRTDRLLLTLVLENLVSNAIKFSQKGTNVTLNADCKYDGVLFTVHDEGPGFTKEDKKLLFNRFQKLSARPTAGEPSIGLGLSIVKKYVTDIGGEVWLESSEGQGSTFFVSLKV